MKATLETDMMLAADTSEGRTPKSLARHLPTAGRLLMGLMFFVFGLNGFLFFLPQPTTPIPEGALAFAGALGKTGYMLPLVKGTEVLVGVLLLSIRFVPLALALLAPVIVNIVAFHAFLAPDGLGLTLFILALEIFLAWSYRSAYRSMLVMRATPGAK